MTKWLLWSNEYRAFWREDRHGFTLDVQDAARFSWDEAIRICAVACQAPEPMINIDGHEMIWHVMMAAPEDAP